MAKLSKQAKAVASRTKAQNAAARKKRAARTAAVKGGAKKIAAPHQQRKSGTGFVAGRVTPAAKKLIKKGAKASAEKAAPAKQLVGRDKNVGRRPKTKREIKRARRRT